MRTCMFFFVLNMKYQPFGSHAIEIKMRSLMFKSPPSTAKYDTTSLNEIEMTSTAMSYVKTHKSYEKTHL